MAALGRNLVLQSVLVVVATLFGAASAAVYDVGGWPACGTGFAYGCDFNRWAATTPLVVGDIVVFRWAHSHNLIKFSSSAAWDTCNATAAPVTFISPQQGSRAFPVGTDFPKGFYKVVVTAEPQYFACLAPLVVNTTTLFLPAFHCINGMKVKIQAGIGGKEVATVPWVDGSTVAPYNNYQTLVDSLKLRRKDSFYLRWYSGAHNVFSFATDAAFDACDLSNATLVAAATRGSYSVQATDKDQYFACGVGAGAHCRGGMKFELKAKP